MRLSKLKKIADKATGETELSHGEKRVWLSRRHGVEHVDEAAGHYADRFEQGLSNGTKQAERAAERANGYTWGSRIAAITGANHAERNEVKKAGEEIGRRFGSVEGLNQAVAEKAERSAKRWDTAKSIVGKPVEWWQNWRAKVNAEKGFQGFFRRNWKTMAVGGAALVGASMLMGNQDKERYDNAYNDTINQLNTMNAASPQIMAGAGNAQQLGTLQQMQMQRG
jgi:hypothetical protein